MWPVRVEGVASECGVGGLMDVASECGIVGSMDVASEGQGCGQ